MGQLKYHNGTSWVPVEGTASDYSALTFNDALQGTINGTNKVFTTSQNFASITVYKNGIKMTPGIGNDYTVTGANQITFNTAPATTTTALTADYSTSASFTATGTNSFVTKQAVTGSVNGSNTSFTTAAGYVGGTLQVFVNGLRQAIAHVTETNPGSGTFTLDTAPLTGDIVEVAYMMAGIGSGNTDTVDGFHASQTPTANTIPVLDGNAMLPNSTLGGAWTAWTPTFTLSGGGSWGNGVLTGRYTQIGKTVKFWAKFQLGSTTNFSGLTGISMTLPVTASSTWPIPSTVGQVFFTNYYSGETVITSSTSVDIYVFGTSGTYLSPAGITPTIPVSWAVGNSAVITGLYEAA